MSGWMKAALAGAAGAYFAHYADDQLKKVWADGTAGAPATRSAAATGVMAGGFYYLLSKAG